MTKIDDLDLSVRTYNAVKRLGIETLEDCRDRFEEIKRHMRVGHKEVQEVLEEHGMFSETPAKLVVSEEYSRAVSLDKKIKANAQAAQESLYEVCKGLKEMRDGKLYKELGYQTFEEYSENEVGVGRRQAERYIKIAETFSEENATPVSHLGSTKLFLLTKLDEQEREDLIQSNNVEDMSKRELEAKIKEIKELEFRLKTVNDGYKHLEKVNHKHYENVKELNVKLGEANREKEEAEKKVQQMTGHLSVLKTDKNMLSEAVEQLKEKIKELENKPVEVAVEDNSEEIEKIKEQLKAEYEDQIYEKHGKLMAQMQMTKESTDAANAARKEVEELKKQLAEKPTEIEVVDFDKLFEVYINSFIDAKNRLKGFVRLHEEYRNSAYMQALRMMEEFKE